MMGIDLAYLLASAVGETVGLRSAHLWGRKLVLMHWVRLQWVDMHAARGIGNTAHKGESEGRAVGDWLGLDGVRKRCARCELSKKVPLCTLCLARSRGGGGVGHLLAACWLAGGAHVNGHRRDSSGAPLQARPPL